MLSTSPRLPADQWRRNLIALTVASFMASLGFVFVMPLLPLFMAELVGGDRAAAAGWSGLAFGISPLVAAVVAPVWGLLGDRYGHKMMVLRALAAIGLLMGVMSLSQDPLHLVLLRAAIGALGAFGPAAMAAAAASAPREEAGRAVGLIQAAQISGTVAGPIIGGVAADILGVRAPFIIVAVLFSLAFVLVLRLYRDKPVQREAGEAKLKPRFSNAALLAIWPLAAALFVMQFADSTFGPLLPLYLMVLGVPAASLASLAGITLSLGALAAAITSYVAPRLDRRWGGRIVFGGLAAATLIVVPIAMATEWWHLIPLRVGLGLSLGAVSALSYAMAAQHTEPGRQGVVMGVLTSAGMIGWAGGALMTGAMAGAGLRLVFYLDAVLLAVVTLAWLLNRGFPGARGSRGAPEPADGPAATVQP